MAGSKINFKAILIEALLIVFTVLLALALNEWRNNVKEENTKIAVLNNIIKEIENNKRLIEEVTGYHEKVFTTFEEYNSNDSLWSTLPNMPGITAFMPIMDQGIKPAILQSGAWKSAELSGVVNSIDYETLYVLSNLYSVQELGTQTTWKSLASIFMEPGSHSNDMRRQIAVTMQLGFRELYYQEQGLVGQYDAALQHLEKYRLE